MDELRRHCPWDKKQTMESLRYLTIEELYELSDNFEQRYGRNKKRTWRHFITYSLLCRIYSETNDFDISNVIHSVCDKLIQTSSYLWRC